MSRTQPPENALDFIRTSDLEGSGLYQKTLDALSAAIGHIVSVRVMRGVDEHRQFGIDSKGIQGTGSASLAEVSAGLSTSADLLNAAIRGKEPVGRPQQLVAQLWDKAMEAELVLKTIASESKDEKLQQHLTPAINAAERLILCSQSVAEVINAFEAGRAAQRAEGRSGKGGREA